MGVLKPKGFNTSESSVSTNAQGFGLVSSPSQEGSSRQRYRLLGPPLKASLGSRAARENHGGKAGRLLKQRCKCGGQMQYDEREELFCMRCNKGPEKKGEASDPRPGHERAKRFKKFRMYAAKSI